MSSQARAVTFCALAVVWVQGFVLPPSLHGAAVRHAGPVPARFVPPGSARGTPCMISVDTGVGAAVESVPVGSADDRIIQIRPNAMAHLKTIKEAQGQQEVYLRMGVRSGGCSGMSYVMELVNADTATEDDMVEEYPELGIKALIDPKSVLYLYGLQLDYSDALIGGGFQFQNPNADQTCGCGKSFGV